ncbi:MAG: NAD-dependent epimerase/dehydratase family protein [Kofleriaceae bacterium]|nr:NAD-dependent epimerase/dehydratase family protein [Kofleriaceae bacterium]
MSDKRFRVGMVGAGDTCEVHVAAVQALPDVELIGVCDLDRETAEAQALRWGTRALPSMDALIEAGANVIHVLGPAAAHGKLAIAALERGCHVLVDKPLAEDEAEARRIGEVARAHGLSASVVHALLFDPQVQDALDQVRSGALGQVVSVDLRRSAVYPPYQGGPLPPWYGHAGAPFRDLGLPCLYLLRELLGPIEDVEADWSSLGGDPNLAFDEWRAMVRCARGLGQFQLTWNTRPPPSQLTIHGRKGVLEVDLSARYRGKRSSTLLPRAAERLVNAVAGSLPPLLDVPAALHQVLHKEVRSDQGLPELVADFYRRLAAGEPPTVSVDDAASVVGWVERVARAADADHAARRARFPRSERVAFVVTGASGAVGRATVARLVSAGHKVRAFVRRIPERPWPGVEYAFGNLGDPVAVDAAIAGADVVIHAGAAMKGGWPEHKGGTVVGTDNVIAACRAHQVRQLVHLSSMSVVDCAGAVGKGAVDERAGLEPRADERGNYTRAKLEAEQRVIAAAGAGLPCVILRPGQIFGGGIPLIGGAVARGAAGRWLVLGDGRLELPLVYLDDLVDAILAAVDRQLVGGQVIQVIDREHLTQTDVLDLAGGDRKVVRVPRPLVFALGKLSELPLGLLGRRSPVALYRLRSALARLTYDSDRAEDLLGWKPRVGVREGIRRVTSAPAQTAPG